MAKTRDEIREHRRQLNAEYRRLFDSVAALLYRHDQIGIDFDFEENTDEYEPEAGSILPKLNGCRSEADVHQVIPAEFFRWFDSGTAGPKSIPRRSLRSFGNFGRNISLSGQLPTNALVCKSGYWIEPF